MVLGLQEPGHRDEAGAGGDDPGTLAYGEPHVAYPGGIHSDEEDTRHGPGLMQIYSRINA
jgi:hypothetical protein